VIEIFDRVNKKVLAAVAMGVTALTARKPEWLVNQKGLPTGGISGKVTACTKSFSIVT